MTWPAGGRPVTWQAMTRGKTARLLLLVFAALLFLAKGQEISSDDFPVPAESSQSADDVAALNSFPYCACTDYRCGSSPYQLATPSVTASTTTTRLCYTFRTVPPLASPPACYTKLANSFVKIQFEVDKSCRAAMVNVTLNNAAKTWLWDDQFATGSMRVTVLRLSSANATGQVLCLTLRNAVTASNGVSPLVDGSTLWRLNFVQAEAVNDRIVYIFSLAVNPTVTAHPLSYRRGSCVNQTLDAISFNLDPAYREAILDVVTYTNLGRVLPNTRAVLTEYGIKVTMLGVLFVDSMPLGDFYTVEVQVNASVWRDTTRFPCLPSLYEPGVPACDYQLHGWQTAPGNHRLQLEDSTGYRYPACCPEGVVQFCKQQINSQCNPRLSDTPYRLQYVDTRTTGTRTTVNFRVTSVAVGAQLGTPACDGSDLAEIKLYVNSSAASALTGATFNSNAISPFSGSDPEQFILLPVNVAAGAVDSPLSLTFTGLRGGVAAVCSLHVGSFRVCNYVMNGLVSASGYQCCARGDVPAQGHSPAASRVVFVVEHRTTRVSSAVNGRQPCERQLYKRRATRPAGWKPPAGQVEHRLVRPAWSQQRDQPVRGLMWCPVVAPRKPPQAPCSSQAATQPAASEPGPSTPLPAKRSKRTEAEQVAEPTQPTKGKGKGQGKAAKAKPTPQPGRWLGRDCNAALNMQRIGESKWCPLELCYWPEQGKLPAKGKEYPGLGYKQLRDKPSKTQPAEAQGLHSVFHCNDGSRLRTKVLLVSSAYISACLSCRL
ncbi:hypothetical protein QJQ45_025912 [Haematococcus lacustris]|nr:hypothetical protein QJQ45_025912 [Haematococcus lacustris]